MNPVKESEITMASVEKFSAGAVRNQLRHNRREIEHSGNPDIDPSRQGQDYVLSPDRGMSDYDYPCRTAALYGTCWLLIGTLLSSRPYSLARHRVRATGHGETVPAERQVAEHIAAQRTCCIM